MWTATRSCQITLGEDLFLIEHRVDMYKPAIARCIMKYFMRDRLPDLDMTIDRMTARFPTTMATNRATTNISCSFCTKNNNCTNYRSYCQQKLIKLIIERFRFHNPRTVIYPPPRLSFVRLSVCLSVCRSVCMLGLHVGVDILVSK